MISETLRIYNLNLSHSLTKQCYFRELFSCQRRRCGDKIRRCVVQALQSPTSGMCHSFLIFGASNLTSRIIPSLQIKDTMSIWKDSLWLTCLEPGLHGPQPQKWLHVRLQAPKRFLFRGPEISSNWSWILLLRRLSFIFIKYRQNIARLEFEHSSQSVANT